MENKGSCPPPQEVLDYKYFKDPESRKDIFEIAKGVSEYLIENNINQLVLIDRAARPAHVAIREYWKNVYPDKDIPSVFFINPNGFSRKINRSQKKINLDLELSYPELQKHKQESILLLDACIHSGRTIKRVLKSFKSDGFSEVNTGVIYLNEYSRNHPRINNLVNFEVLSKEPYLGCSPFGRDKLVNTISKEITSTISKNEDDIFKSQVLRKEISQIIKEQLKIESSEKISQPVRKPYLVQDLDYIKSAGGTPPQIAKDNPGKTMAELMTDEEILDYLNKMKHRIDNPEEGFEDCSYADQVYGGIRTKRILEPEFKASIEYLKQINKLPPEYSQK